LLQRGNGKGKASGRGCTRGGNSPAQSSGSSGGGEVGWTGERKKNEKRGGQVKKKESGKQAHPRGGKGVVKGNVLCMFC